MPLSIIGAFWLMSFMLAWVPGADWAYTINAAIRHRTPVPAVAGLGLGYVILALLAAVGASAVIAGVPGALATLTIIGSAYLLWLGVTTLLNPPTLHGVVPEGATDTASIKVTTASQQFLTGVGISGLNPKALLTYVVLLPQFTSVDNTWPMMIQLGVLGLIHTLNCVLVYLIVGFSARKVLATRPSAAKWVSRASGVVMIVIALMLVGEQVAHWL